MSRATKCDSYKEEQIRPGYKNITIGVGERDVLGKHYQCDGGHLLLVGPFEGMAYGQAGWWPGLRSG